MDSQTFPDPVSLDSSRYSRVAVAHAVTDVPVARLWSQITAIGGENGWYYLHGLWSLRGRLDELMGGVGLRRGRRHPRTVQVGDVIDCWRVAVVEPERRLWLSAEMKMPGLAALEFSLASAGPGRTRVTTRAMFEPGGVLGHLYWNSLLPLHNVLFRGLTREIIRRAAGAGVHSA